MKNQDQQGIIHKAKSHKEQSTGNMMKTQGVNIAVTQETQLNIHKIKASAWTWYTMT